MYIYIEREKKEETNEREDIKRVKCGGSVANATKKEGASTPVGDKHTIIF